MLCSNFPSEIFLNSLPGRWQEALIKELSPKYNTMLFNSIKNHKLIFPETVLEISKKLSSTEYKESLIAELFKYLELGATPHLRAQTLMALEFLKIKITFIRYLIL